MKGKKIKNVLVLLAVGIIGFTSNVAAKTKPLKVYILAGQSNMQGSAHKSTFAAIGDDPKTAPLLSEILDKNGEPIVCDNAWITYLTKRGDSDTVLNGKVKVGYGFDNERIGPEYAFGLFMDKALDEPVLIIKTAWGGKSLAVDFRPPSAGLYEPSAQEKERGSVPKKEQVGHYYREMIQYIRATLKDTESIRKIVPGYDAKQGYELAGFVWFQGWNDMCNRHHIEQYTGNMIHFIRDVRHDLGVPTMPFIVGVLGVYGTQPDSRKFDKGLPVTAFRKTQFAAVQQYDQKVAAPYRGNVIAVDCGPYYEQELSDIYWKRRMTSDWKQGVKKGEMTQEKFQEECSYYGFGDGEVTPEEQRTWDRCASNAEYHYLGSGKTFVRFGKALAEAMLKMENKSDAGPAIARLKGLVLEKLWDDDAKFFKVLPRGEQAVKVDVRELHGFTPWYFDLPDKGKGYEVAWKQLMDPKGFYAPFGPTTAEQRHPKFSISYKGHECQWNGPSWPFATAVTLTALANVFNDYPQQVVSSKDYFETLKIYTKSHRLKREDGSVVPWIDENLNPYTGDWIARSRLKVWKDGTWDQGKGGVERGKDYNHSSYCDLIITGLVGLRPRADDTVEVNPLLPDGT